jgi:hypothetical protein
MKVVDPEKLQNFVVYNFLFEIILSMKFKFRKRPQMEKIPAWKL